LYLFALLLKSCFFFGQTNGFFIECGAFDGLRYSNTFYIERQLNWTGLMIEAVPINFKLALEKKRNVTLVPACLNLINKPKMSDFPSAFYAGSRIADSASSSTVKVQCLPLYSILLALNRTKIDIFSLDIEGHELTVLKTIPFDKVDIKVNFRFLMQAFYTLIFVPLYPLFAQNIFYLSNIPF
jgi:hypothetical protein